MKYSETLVKQWAEEIIGAAKQSTTCSYVIRYGNVDSFDPTDRECQKDVIEYLWDWKHLDDNLQAVDFNDKAQLIVVMWYEPPKKEIEEVKEMKKYTLKEWEKFCQDALIMPPFEDDEQIEEWFNTHKIHIVANGHIMELEYDADAVNEIEFSLREIYNAIHGDGTATTGNTVGSEYRDATWKDVLKADALSRFYDRSDLDLKGAIHASIQNFTRGRFTELMKELETKSSLGDEIEVNFSKLDTRDLWKIFNMSDRKQAFKEMLCQKIEIEELVDKNGMSSDRVVITDYSMKFAGDVVGWHYGIDWDKDSVDNQYYIQKYIKEMIE
jgi:hypothetical protein